MIYLPFTLQSQTLREEGTESGASFEMAALPKEWPLVSAAFFVLFGNPRSS